MEFKRVDLDDEDGASLATVHPSEPWASYSIPWPAVACFG